MYRPRPRPRRRSPDRRGTPAEPPQHPARAGCAWRRLALAGVFAAAAAARLCAGDADREGALALLDNFRRSIYAEPIYIEFDLREMPRRGDERLFRGRLWGTRNERGPVARLELDGPKGAPPTAVLVQGGPGPEIWVSQSGGPGLRNDQAILEPLVPGSEMTPFDLQMPYLYWLDAEFAGATRLRGRPTDVFVFTPPAEFTAACPAVASVRAYLDTQYDAFMQSEVEAPGGQVAKTLSLLELRKVGERWIPRDLDARNELTRNKTRLSVTGVTIGAAVPRPDLDPAHLGAPAPRPADASITRITQ